MTSAIATTSPAALATREWFTSEQVQLISRTIAPGCTPDELKLFLYQCQRTGLDPFSRQIYAIRRKEFSSDQDRWVERMTIQTGIDGYRIIADRTGRYAPGPETAFEVGEKGAIVSATAHVKKLTPDGTWHLVSATAHFDEYAAFRKDGKPTKMWSEKPRIMLAKCAEALALRKAFPAELSGVYTAEEMSKRDAESEYTPPGGDGDKAGLLAGAAIQHAVETGTSTTLVQGEDQAPKAQERRPPQAAASGSSAAPVAAPKTGKPPQATGTQAKHTTVVAPGKPSLSQVMRLNIAIQTMGITDREEKLRWCEGMLGMKPRSLPSSNDIPAARIGQLISDAEAGVVPPDWPYLATGDLPDYPINLPDPGRQPGEEG